jgi:hypothetical protein
MYIKYINVKYNFKYFFKLTIFVIFLSLPSFCPTLHLYIILCHSEIFIAVYSPTGIKMYPTHYCHSRHSPFLLLYKFPFIHIPCRKSVYFHYFSKWHSIGSFRLLSRLFLAPSLYTLHHSGLIKHLLFFFSTQVFKKDRGSESLLSLPSWYCSLITFH